MLLNNKNEIMLFAIEKELVIELSSYPKKYFSCIIESFLIIRKAVESNSL